MFWKLLLLFLLQVLLPGPGFGSVDVSCRRRLMLVRVRRSLIPADAALKLGTCDVSGSTRDFLYFKSGLMECGSKRRVDPNSIVYLNVLHYRPPAGPIRRAAAFSLPVGCRFHRFLYTNAATGMKTGDSEPEPSAPDAKTGRLGKALDWPFAGTAVTRNDDEEERCEETTKSKDGGRALGDVFVFEE